MSRFEITQCQLDATAKLTHCLERVAVHMTPEERADVFNSLRSVAQHLDRELASQRALALCGIESQRPTIN